jgi:hypothetical protein
MKARKVAIMLALTALTGLTLFVISLVDSEAFGAEAPSGFHAPAVPDTLEYLGEKLTIGPDGNANVEIMAVLAKGGSGDLLLPLAFEETQDITILSGPISFGLDSTGSVQPVREVLGYIMLNLQVDSSAIPGDTLIVSARVPGWFDRKEAAEEYGEFRMTRNYVNTSVLVFRDFRLGLDLPEGMLVHSVINVVPDFNPKASPQPPYEIGRMGDRGWATLHQVNLAPAQSCMLDLHVRPARRGVIPLFTGLAAAILYLAFFRDVLKAKETE